MPDIVAHQKICAHAAALRDLMLGIQCLSGSTAPSSFSRRAVHQGLAGGIGMDTFNIALDECYFSFLI